MNEHKMQEQMKNAIDHRLSGLEGNPYLAQRIIAAEKGEKPVMKKKLSVSLALVLLLMILTAGVAIALVQSNIADHLYGGEENIPEGVVEQIMQPQATQSTALGALSIDELLYDGSGLHTSFTIENPTQDALLYTLEGIWVNGDPVVYNRMITEGTWDSGFVLGGSVDGKDMAQSISIYNRAEQIYKFGENGKYAGMEMLPKGDVTLKIAVAVWRPINDVELLDYSQYEGEDSAATKDHLTVDGNGFSLLWRFIPKEDYVSYKANESGAQIYSEIYKKLGWAELVDMIEVETKVNLDENWIARAVPESMEYELEGCRLVFNQFDLTHAGGRIDGWIYGDYAAVKEQMKIGMMLVDRENGRILSDGTFWGEQREGLHFSLTLAPVTGELPDQVYLAPAVANNPCWDETLPCYDPNLEKPDGVIREFQFDFDHAILIQLEQSK
ncbi:MAG: hypothetical protein E7336_07870 [Clostridiales bacterium]|nr:hypothetical protein [Clostridiales bacterium]